MQSPTWAIYLPVLLLPLALLLLRLRRRPNLPPGPRPWPVIGNLNLIGSLPHRSIHLLSQKHGPIIYLRFGSHPVVVASSVDMAEQFLKTHDLNFASRPKTAAGKYTAYNYAFMTWSDYGPFWRQARKIYLTELFSPRRLASFETVRVQEVQLLLRRLFASAGEAVNMKHLLYMLNVGILSRIVWGKKYLDESATPEAASKGSSELAVEFKKMVDELFVLNGVLNIGDFIPWLSFFDLQGYIKRMKVVGVWFDRFLELLLQEHEEWRRRVAAEDFMARDMVDVLLQLAGDSNLEVPLSRDDVKALTLELIAGGTESSSSTVEWAISEILKHPHIFERAAEELDRVIGKERWVEERDLHLLPYIESIMKETLRMHPVAPLLTPHLAREDCKISGYDIPAGTRVHVNTWSISRDPKLWDSPDEFRPERFIENDIDVKGKDYRLLPFGSGRRMCPGYNLGLKVVHLSLANLLHGFIWKLPKEMHAEDLNMEEIFGLSMPKKFPLEAVVEPRLALHLYCF